MGLEGMAGSASAYRLRQWVQQGRRWGASPSGRVLRSPIGVTDGKAALSGWLRMHVRIEPEGHGHRGYQDLRPLLLSIA
jgi:hypothetical protein